MTQKQLIKAGKALGIPLGVVKYASANIKDCYPLLQKVADRDALMRSSCQTPRPAPKFEPGYWGCVGGEWVWVPAV